MILIFSVFTLALSFEQGTKTFGGTGGLYSDLENDYNIYWVSPQFGAFVLDNLLVEGGFTWAMVDTGNDSDSEIAFGFGIKMFMKNDYVGDGRDLVTVREFELVPYAGFEFVPGAKGGVFHSTNLGTEGPQLPIDLAEDDEMMIVKLGILSPIANNIAFIPQDFSTTINGLSRPTIFKFSRLSSNIYELKDTVSINGKFGLAIDVLDKIDSQPFNYGVYKIEMYIDDDKSYEVSYDIYNYQDDKYIYNERDYQLKQETGDTYYRLFADINKDMLFINPEYSKPYILFNDNKYHKFKMIISDFNNNKSYIS